MSSRELGFRLDLDLLDLSTSARNLSTIFWILIVSCDAYTPNMLAGNSEPAGRLAAVFFSTLRLRVDAVCAANRSLFGLNFGLIRLLRFRKNGLVQGQCRIRSVA